MSIPITFNCIICYDRFDREERPPVILPCGHTFVCQVCSKRLTKCHECRTDLFMEVNTTNTPNNSNNNNTNNSVNGNVIRNNTSNESDRRRYAYLNGRGATRRQQHANAAATSQQQKLIQKKKEKIPLPLPKNNVLLNLMEIAERQQRELKKENNEKENRQDGLPSPEILDDDEEIEEALIKSSVDSVVSNTHGTYAVVAKEGIVIHKEKPNSYNLKWIKASLQLQLEKQQKEKENKLYCPSLELPSLPKMVEEQRVVPPVSPTNSITTSTSTTSHTHNNKATRRLKLVSSSLSLGSMRSLRMSSSSGVASSPTTKNNKKNKQKKKDFLLKKKNKMAEGSIQEEGLSNNNNNTFDILSMTSDKAVAFARLHLPYQSIIQLVDIDEQSGYGKLVRDEGYVEMKGKNGKPNVIKVGPAQDKVCRIENILCKLSMQKCDIENQITAWEKRYDAAILEEPTTTKELQDNYFEIIRKNFEADQKQEKKDQAKEKATENKNVIKNTKIVMVGSPSNHITSTNANRAATSNAAPRTPRQTTTVSSSTTTQQAALRERRTPPRTSPIRQHIPTTPVIDWRTGMSGHLGVSSNSTSAHHAFLHFPSLFTWKTNKGSTNNPTSSSSDNHNHNTNNINTNTNNTNTNRSPRTPTKARPTPYRSNNVPLISEHCGLSQCRRFHSTAIPSPVPVRPSSIYHYHHHQQHNQQKQKNHPTKTMTKSEVNHSEITSGNQSTHSNNSNVASASW